MARHSTMTPDEVYVDPVRRQRVRRRSARQMLVGLASLAVTVGLIVWLVPKSPGWSVVQQSFFSPEQFAASFPELLKAFWLNVRIFLIAEPLILILGILIALSRGLRNPILLPIKLVATVYTDIFRGIPTILLIYLLGFGVPALRLQGVPKDPVFWGIAALVLSYGAYVAEVFRAGIDTVPQNQRMGARALGLTSLQTTRFVVLPQAIRNVVPPLLNDFISLQKDTALVAVIGPIEVLRQAQIDASTTFNYTPYVAAACIFIALTIPMTRLADWLTARSRLRTRAGGTA